MLYSVPKRYRTVQPIKVKSLEECRLRIGLLYFEDQVVLIPNIFALLLPDDIQEVGKIGNIIKVL
ncbi:MAG TPA: hypothetical protein DDZ66_10410 [Firmicutes bacterium]|nr:hypothetical protein [Bacillota bacterium]